MSRASRSGKSGDSGDDFGGLEALGFIAPTVAPPVTPAAVVYPVAPGIPPVVATSVVPAAAVPFAAPHAPAAPMTRRQLREMETLRSGGVQNAVSPPPMFDSPAPMAFAAGSTYQERGRRGEASSAPAGAKIARGGQNYSRTTTPPRTSPQRAVRGSLRKRLASQLFSGAAMILAAAFLVGATVPANAFMPTSQELAESPAPEVMQADAQSLAVSADVVEAAPVRAKFTVTSYADLLRQRYGNITYDYAITTGAIRWPFPYVVPISSGYGARVAPCRGCSSMHMGTDFVPGYGTPIYSVADGIVTAHDIASWGLGNSVVISHNVNGLAFDSVYAHMASGSVVVEAGQEIKVGDLIGLVGSTGSSTGAHLHFEIHVNAVQVDPFAWLKANVSN